MVCFKEKELSLMVCTLLMALIYDMNFVKLCAPLYSVYGSHMALRALASK